MILHIGCGPIYINGMINIDSSPNYKTDICSSVFDLNFDENSVDRIWACHFLEHLDYPIETVQCLNLFYKWLKSNGILRLALPDLKKIAYFYIHSPDKLHEIYVPDCGYYYKRNSFAERVNFFIKGWEHKMCFDFELINILLLDCGFRNIQEVGYNCTHFGIWNYDRYPSESFYIEVQK